MAALHLAPTASSRTNPLGEALARVARARPDALIVLPTRSCVVVSGQLLPQIEGIGNVRVIEPLAFAPFCYLLSRATLVLTDSGGVEELAPSSRKPTSSRVGARVLTATLV